MSQRCVLEVEDGGVHLRRVDLDDVVTDAGVEVPFAGEQGDRPRQAVDLLGRSRYEIVRGFAGHAAEHRSGSGPDAAPGFRRKDARSAGGAR